MCKWTKSSLDQLDYSDNLTMQLLSHLRVLLRPYWKQVSLSLLALLFITAAQLVIPRIIQQVIDTGLPNGDVGFLIVSALIIVGIGILRAFVYFWQRYLNAWVAQKVSFDLRNRLYNHIQRLPFSYHDRAQTGQLISCCIEDVYSTNEFMGFGVGELFSITFLFTGITILLFSNNPRLAVVALIPMLPLVLITTRFGKRITRLFFQVDQALGKLSARLQENVSGAQVVRAFVREPFEINRFDQANKDLYDIRVTALSEFAKIFPSTHLLVTIGTILILWFGGHMVLRGELTLGELVAFNAFLLLMAQPAQRLAWTVNMGGEAAAGLQRIFEILNHEPTIKSPPCAISLPTLSGWVEFRDVWFRYEGEQTTALEDIQLTVQPNQIIALIGQTGSGKSSLINLIPRFHDVEKGAVLVDGHDIRQVDLPSLRQQIGIVLQTTLLFSESVVENIAFGRLDATDEAIIKAAKAAQAHEFITNLPEGYNTIVGERGTTLSGGQRQRVAIARALLMDPRILILDDSTSSVDIETEHQIQQALNHLMAGRTTFVIAHRLATVRRADLILVLDGGRIVARGRHDDLLAQGGLYREIYELQLKGQEEVLEETRAFAD